MSALGQKQTFETGTAMSALPPKADIISFAMIITAHTRGAFDARPSGSRHIDTSSDGHRDGDHDQYFLGNRVLKA